MARDCKYVARVDADTSDFEGLFEQAKKIAGSSDRFVEIRGGYMTFHFESQKAHSQFLTFIERRKMQQRFQECRKLVYDDAFEGRVTADLAIPLLGNVPNEMKTKYLYDVAIFLRRILTRYLALVMCRLLEKPNDSGKTGVTASIASLLEIIRDEALLDAKTIDDLCAEFERIKNGAADGEYDLVKSLFGLRNMQIAHSLIPWKEPTEELWAHHLLDFVDAIFGFVVKVEEALTTATGTALGNLEESVQSFRESAGQFWRAQTTLRFLADGEPPNGKLAK